ncbi:MAG: phosphoglucosamine mutase [Microthrixaceae bacterium]|nr:phosphoglucosamine mutase [Microthrixaceae bacterium]
MRFGTDGIRGLANAELTPELCLAIGRATARVLGGPTVLIGRDTRRSGSMIEAALAAGICAEGVGVTLLGVVPTPAVAALGAADSLVGVVISASHNAAPDNGIKVFGPGGTKLSDELQRRVEETIEEVRAGGGIGRGITGAALGSIHSDAGGMGRYRSMLLDALEGRRLDGLEVVLDCANGAASGIAPEVFEALGASVHVLHANPDGLNINDRCGSTHPEDLSDAVVERGAQLGFAFDGDADRVLAVDAAGRLIDGDQLIAVAALDLKRRGRLRGDSVVVTVMSNLGFRLGMAAAGIGLVETAVGDRFVLEALDRDGLSLGGEQSGHLIFRDLATTGDGVLSAVLISDVVVRSGISLSALADAAMTRLPQVLRNVRLPERDPGLVGRLEPEIERARERLGAAGRVLVRESGTEPLVRVMVEATDEAVAADVAEELVAAVEAAS